jgi:hypothetical protein
LLKGWLPNVPREQPAAAKGLFDAPGRAADHTATRPNIPREVGEPVVLSTYTVHCYVTVCVKLTGIVAGSHRDAARLARERFSWEAHEGEVEFVDELHEMLVDVQGDEDYSRSVAFTADLEPVY